MHLATQGDCLNARLPLESCENVLDGGGDLCRHKRHLLPVLCRQDGVQGLQQRICLHPLHGATASEPHSSARQAMELQRQAQTGLKCNVRDLSR